MILTPSLASSLGSAPATSPRPPTLAIGATSALRNSVFIWFFVDIFIEMS